jgi:hypothetical protein
LRREASLKEARSWAQKPLCFESAASALSCAVTSGIWLISNRVGAKRGVPLVPILVSVLTQAVDGRATEPVVLQRRCADGYEQPLTGRAP